MWPPPLRGDLHGFGQVELALGIGVADFLQRRREDRPAKGHDAGVAEADLSLVGTGVPLLANGGQAPLVHHQPAVAGGVLGAEAEDDDVSPRRQRLAHAAERLRSDQRRVRVEHQHVVNWLGERRLGGLDRVGRAAAFGLFVDGGAPRDPHDDRAECIHPRADHDGDRRRAGGRGCVQRVPDHGQAADLVHRLGQGGAHPRPLPRRQHDRQA